MLKLGQAYVDEMIAHAREDAPNECCGIIAADEGGTAIKLYRAVNAEASPYRYEVATDDLFRINREIDDNDWEVMVIYHSHTHTEAYPSKTDRRLATGWPGPHYVIVSLEDEANPVVRAFKITDGEVTEEELETS